MTWRGLFLLRSGYLLLKSTRQYGRENHVGAGRQISAVERSGAPPFAAISAVGGLHLTDEMKRDFAEFDRLRLSFGERRKAILAKYTKNA